MNVSVGLRKVRVGDDLIPDLVDDKDDWDTNCPSPEGKLPVCFHVLLDVHRQEGKTDHDLGDASDQVELKPELG